MNAACKFRSLSLCNLVLNVTVVSDHLTINRVRFIHCTIFHCFSLGLDLWYFGEAIKQARCL